MAGYTVTIEGGQISVFVDGHMSEDEAYIEGCNKIREALKGLKGAIRISPHYRKPVKIERHVDRDPRD